MPPQNTYFSELVWLFVVLLVLLMVGRALYVVPACWLHNVWSSEKVSVRDVVIIWCAPEGGGWKGEMMKPLCGLSPYRFLLYRNYDGACVVTMGRCGTWAEYVCALPA